jgi:hypothetical protein
MKLIQTILIISLLLSLGAYFARFRSHILDRLFALGLFLGAIGCIMFPTITQDLAEFVGVGRGTDLFLYVFAVASLFVGILLYSRVHRLESALTEVVRELAIRDANNGANE